VTEVPSRRTAWSTAAILVSCTVALLTGCSAQPDASTSTVTAQDLYDETETTWFAGPFDPAEALTESPDELTETAGEPPTEPGTELPITSYGGAIAQVDVDPNITIPDPVPCEMLPLASWQKWMGNDATQYEVDPGESCIYLEPSDLTRMTFEYLQGGDTGLITTELLRKAEYVQLGDQTIWVPESPVSYANTLYTTAGDDMFVITIYNADPEHQGDQKDQAVAWMTSILEGASQ
jgi:hypothetical protein